MNLDDWKGPGENDESLQKGSKKAEKTPCACGRAVCCGKHKKGQCACKCKQKEHN